jgi:hypothetical protein
LAARLIRWIWCVMAEVRAARRVFRMLIMEWVLLWRS